MLWSTALLSSFASKWRRQVSQYYAIHVHSFSPGGPWTFRFIWAGEPLNYEGLWQCRIWFGEEMCFFEFKLLYCVFQACEECKMISRKLCEKPNSIEDLAEQRDWMKQIPDQLKAHEVEETFLFNSFFFPCKVAGYAFKLLLSLLNRTSRSDVTSLYWFTVLPLTMLIKYAFWITWVVVWSTKEPKDWNLHHFIFYQEGISGKKKNWSVYKITGGAIHLGYRTN